MTFKDLVLLTAIAAATFLAWVFWDEILQHLQRIGVIA